MFIDEAEHKRYVDNGWHLTPDPGCRFCADVSPIDTNSSELLGIVAGMVRLEGGCEKGHSKGIWHMHEEEYLAKARRINNLVKR